MSEQSEILICEAKKLILQILNREWRPMRFHEILANFGYKDAKSNVDICHVLTHALHDLVKTKKIKRTVGKLGVFYKLESAPTPYLHSPKPQQPKYIAPKINHHDNWRSYDKKYGYDKKYNHYQTDSWMDYLGFGWLRDLLDVLFGEEILLIIFLLGLFVAFALILSAPVR